MNRGVKNRYHALVPTLYEVIFYTFLALLLLLFVSYKRIAAYYGFTGFELTMPDSILNIQTYLDERILPVFFTALAWGFVGFLVYVGFWILFDTIFRASDANPMHHHYVFSSEEQRHHFIVTMFGQIYLRVLAIALLIAWIVMLFKVIPIFGIYFYTLVTDPTLDRTLLAGIGAIPLAGLYLFMMAPLTRLIFLRPRVFSD